MTLSNLYPIGLLLISNIFMTFAWYGHLKTLNDKPLWIVIIISWSIAFFEYLFMVPANRLGAGLYSLPQLKILQEVITMVVFSLFTVFYMKEDLKWDYLWAGCCLLGAVYFIFRSK